MVRICFGAPSRNGSGPAPPNSSGESEAPRAIAMPAYSGDDAVYLVTDLIETAIAAAVRGGLPERETVSMALRHVVSFLGPVLGPEEAATLLRQQARILVDNPEVYADPNGLSGPERTVGVHPDVMLAAMIEGAAAMALRNGIATDTVRHTGSEALAKALSQDQP